MQRQPSFIIRAALFVLFLTPVSALAQQAQAQPQAKPPSQPQPQQEFAEFGLVAMSSSAVGFQWNFSDRLAFRPELGFAHTGSSSTATTTTTGATSTSPGIAVLYYTSKWDAVKAYISPRYAFSHSTTDTTTAGTTTTSTTNANNFSGSLGAEYAAHRHFAAFGEVGLNYAHTKNTNSVTTTELTTNNWSIRAVVGAIFYF